MRSILDSGKLRALLAGALLMISAVPATAQEAVPPADANRLEPDGFFLFVLDGRTQRQAKVFSSKVAVVFLIVDDGLDSPILVSPRTQSVESVEPAGVIHHEDGTVELTGDGARGEIDRYRLDGKKVVWTMTDGRQAKLVERPWLLGRLAARPLKENPAYLRGANLYEPSESHLEILRSLGLEGVRVKTYFGSWCPHCQEIVPRILRVADELQGAGIRFEYYGLPKSFLTDPEAERLKIEAVPTVLILIDGEETARLMGNDLHSPEVGLKSVLGGS